MILCEEEEEKINKNDLELLSKLRELYIFVDKYYPANICKLDETGLFCNILPKYGLVLLLGE